jgi:hypothetical protein
MEKPVKETKVARYDPEEIFYSDEEDEKDLQTTLQASGNIKTVFRLGHAIGTQEIVEQINKSEESPEGTAKTTLKLAEDFSNNIASARSQSRYAQRYTEQVMDTLELVRTVNSRLIRRVMDMERQARNQEIRARSMLERIRIQEDIIKKLAAKVRDEDEHRNRSEM